MSVRFLLRPACWSEARADSTARRRRGVGAGTGSDRRPLPQSAPCNLHIAVWVDCRLATMSGQLQRSLEAVRASFHVRSSVSGDQIASLAEQGHLDMALDVLRSMDGEGIVPSADTYRSLLKACTKKRALVQAKRVHTHLAKHGLESTRFLGESVVSTFVKCGGLEDALEVFRRLPKRTVFSWTALITGYSMSGQGEEGLRLYRLMQEEGVRPDAYTFVSLLRACGSIPNLKEGKRIHAEAVRYRCEADLFVQTCLIDMYAKCGSIADAKNVFATLSQPDVVSWNVMLTAYVEQGQAGEALQLYEQMREQGVSPSNRTFVSVFQACGMLAEKEEAVWVNGHASKVKSLAKGKAVHVDACRKGCESDVYVASTLVSMYGKSGSIVDAQNVFDGLLRCDVVAWNAILTVHVEQGQSEKALQLYAEMREQGVSPNNRTFVSTLQACGALADKDEDVMVYGLSIRGKSYEKGKVIYADICRKGCRSDVFVGTTGISMFAKCGSIKDAQNVFDGLPQCNVVSWNALLAAFVEQGRAEEALVMYEKMPEQGVTPDAWTYVRVIQACGMLAEKDEAALVDGRLLKVKSLKRGRLLHAAVFAQGLGSDVFVCSTLVSMYGKCWSVVDAKCSFDGLSQCDVVVWNALLTSYVEQSQAADAFELYMRIRAEGTSPDAWTFVSALHACHILADEEDKVIVNGMSTKVGTLEKGKAIHADAEMQGCNADVFLGSVLVTLYGKCGSMADAQKVFDGLPKRDVVAWNSILAAYVGQAEADKALQLYELFIEEDLSPDAWTFASTLQACGMLARNEDEVRPVDGQSVKVKALEKGEAVHADICKKGYDSDVFVCTTLITMYGNCGSTMHAQKVFDQLSTRNVVTWNAMLAVYVGQGQAEKALQLYERMWEEGVSPDTWTFVNSVQACGLLAEDEEEFVADGISSNPKSLAKGVAIHGDAQRKGYASDIFVGNTLITMYGKCGCVIDAQSVFDGLSEHGIVSWNSLLAAYVEQGQGEKALQLYELFLEEGVSADDRTFVIALQACGIEADDEEGEENLVVTDRPIKVNCLRRGKTIHDEICRKGYDANVFVGSTLVSVYGKCGSLVDAQNVFQRLHERNVVSWNAMLAVFVEQGQAQNALQLYEQMQEEGVNPGSRTFVSVLQACGLLADDEKEVTVDGQPTKVTSLKVGVAIHAHTWTRGHDSDVFVANTLVSMYGKCGTVACAWSVFHELSSPGTVSWNAMLAAYVEQLQAEESLQLYRQMQQDGVVLDRRTFVSTLQACGMLAEKEVEVVLDGKSVKLESLEQVKAVHSNAHRKGHDSDVFVGNTLVNVYGKCGSILDAWNVFNALPERNIVSWNAMLLAFVEQDHAEKALQLYQQMEQEGMNPNEITLVCFLQACSKTGSLGILRQTHQTILSTANEVSPLLGNTLISAYGRCASLVEAQAAFDALPQPDVVSWNALIAAYAREGQFAASLLCYEKLCLAGIKPNGVTFLSLLSACSHGGLVNKGAEYFELMVNCHGIVPEIQHYVTMVDLFGRAGCFARVEALLSTMPISPDLVMWLCLLGACRKHKNIVLAEQAFRRAVRLHPQHPAAYVLMSNIYADAGLLDRAEEVAKLRETEGAWKNPGRCWIQHKEELHSFLVGT